MRLGQHPGTVRLSLGIIVRDPGAINGCATSDGHSIGSITPWPESAGFRNPKWPQMLEPAAGPAARPVRSFAFFNRVADAFGLEDPNYFDNPPPRWRSSPSRKARLMIALAPLGDRAALAKFATEAEAAAWASSVRDQGWPGVLDIVLAYQTVAVFANPDRIEPGELERKLAKWSPVPGTGPPASGSACPCCTTVKTWPRSPDGWG